MIPDRQLDPHAVLPAFGLHDGRPFHAQAGFSGATVWQVESGQSQFALKAYPSNWGDARRLLGIHQQVTIAGSDLMPQPLPRLSGITVVESQGRLWDATPWFNGQPIREVDTPTLEAVAHLHLRWQRQTRPPQPSETVTRQWAILDAWQIGHVDMPPHGGFADHVSLLNGLVESTRDAIRPWLNRPLPAQTIHGDLWPGNVLVTLGRPPCIIDGASIRIDCIVSDLARLSGVIDRTTRQLIATAYEPTRPLHAIEWDMLDVLSRTSPVIRLAQWLIWLVLERRTFANPQAAKQRFGEVVEQCRFV